MNRLTPTPLGWRLLRFAGDVGAAVGAFYLAFLLRIRFPLPFTQFLLPEERIRFFFREWWIIALAQALTLYFFGFYDPPRGALGAEQARRLATAATLQGLVLAGFYFLTDREFPRSVLLLFVALNFLLLWAFRSLMERGYRPPRRRVALVGAGPAARELAAKIASLASASIAIVGHAPAPDESAEAEPEPDSPLGPRLGAVEDLPRLLAAGEIDDIILATEARAWQIRLLDELSASRSAAGNVLMLPGPIESLIGRMRYRWVEDLPLIEVVRQSEWKVNRPLKRVVDAVGSSLLLLLLLPALLLVALAVAVTSPGPILYRQQRLGLGRKPFTVWKFRTMRTDAEQGVGEVLATRRDPRLTPIGAWLRRYRLDELPQLLNVLGGSMSLVGPRPERPGFVERYLGAVPGYAERFSVPPGLTGLAQVNGDYHSTAENKLRYDLAYIANWSPWLDLAILLRTVKIVLTSRGV
ncbi:MAG TPA: sugar transferase [Thermoanaerobaculia bacterium]|nr:sugar transferase [Thermoanaerobaculia bacterium]